MGPPLQVTGPRIPVFEPSRERRYARGVSPEIRPARLADAVRIARMSRLRIEQGLSWRWTPDAIASRIRDPETAVVIAACDEHMLGFAIMGFRFLHREAHLLLLAVDPPARRHRVGLSLWRWLETIARRGGITRVLLEVRAGNADARAFYRAIGFREISRLGGYYEGREDAWRMGADLHPNGRASTLGRGAPRGVDGSRPTELEFTPIASIARQRQPPSG